MARLPRFVMPGQPQHVIQRGNNREAIFRAEADYRFYREKLRAAAAKHACAIHAYVLMTNHVHLLVTPHSEHSVGKMMQRLGRYYVRYFNDCYARTGTLWPLSRIHAPAAFVPPCTSGRPLSGDAD